MSENDEIKNLINNADSDSDDIELNNKVEKKTRKVRKDKTEKPPKKEYVFTEARQNQMKIAHDIKMKNASIRQEERAKQKEEFLKKKKELEDKKFMLMKKKEEKQLMLLKKDIDEHSDESSGEDEIIIMKKPRRKGVYIQPKEKKVISKQEPEIIKPPVKHYAYF